MKKEYKNLLPDNICFNGNCSRFVYYETCKTESNSMGYYSQYYRYCFPSE